MSNQWSIIALLETKHLQNYHLHFFDQSMMATKLHFWRKTRVKSCLIWLLFNFQRFRGFQNLPLLSLHHKIEESFVTKLNARFLSTQNSMHMFCRGAKFDMNIKVFVACIGSFYNRLSQRSAIFGTFRIFMFKELRNYWIDSWLQSLPPEFFALAWLLEFTNFESCWNPEDRSNPKVPSTVISLWLPLLFHTKIRALFNAMRQKENSCFMRNVGFSSSHQDPDSSINKNFIINITFLYMQILIAPTRRGVNFAIKDLTKPQQ